MKRRALYSRATRSRSAVASAWLARAASEPVLSELADEFDPGPSVFGLAWDWIKRLYRRHERPILMAASVVISLAAIGGYSLMKVHPRVLTQGDIDAAVQYTLSNTPRAPIDSARAAAIMRPSVVEVEGFLSPEHAAALAAAAAKDAAKKHQPQTP